MCVPGTVEIVRARLEAQPPPRIEPPRVTRRAALLAAAGTALAATVPSRAFGQRGSSFGSKVADLTHTFSEEFPLFPGSPPISRTTLVTVQDNGYYGQQWTLSEHACTHMDAPAHFVVNGRTVTQLRVSELVAPVVVINIADRAATDPDTVVTPADLRAFERRHGRIPRGALVCMHSGWEERAGSVEAYGNVDANGVLHFPGFGKPAVDWLLAERDIRGIGVDTLSLDRGSSPTFDVHSTLLPANRYGIENLRGLATIPPRGATMYVGVIPWRNGSGGPCRAFAAW
jgi:kynurenine formamidase